MFKSHAPAEALLNSYQGKARLSNVPAYITTLGVLGLIAGSIHSSSLQSEPARSDTQLAYAIPGAIMAAGGLAYGLFSLINKENTLEKAIENYNDAVPTPDRVSVILSPAPSTDGGEIKTQVPF